MSCSLQFQKVERNLFVFTIIGTYFLYQLWYFCTLIEKGNTTCESLHLFVLVWSKMGTFQMRILLDKRATTPSPTRYVLITLYWELSNEVLFKFLSQGTSEISKLLIFNFIFQNRPFLERLKDNIGYPKWTLISEIIQLLWKAAELIFL